ncbi:MAG TPA: electron transport complex subunit RsxC [Bacteroidales bacterium]|nr:MAG: electron transporter RnfC [Bacteroidetes bacterium GWE2_42_24]OFY29501.1 MAG: electron transporter RnfC [Bacteroidetes bacterium GWF2_43_11]HAQ64701.1 electron transport complex subunit RsxC [Bacteroidales bacterium]HBZ67297.1 electron transport complex subunit RsxC [Bacteroidales bacterium]
MKTFKIGGVHPEENKLSAGKPIEVFPIPQKVYIPLSQSLGAPSKPVVKKGDVVKVGQMIAQGEGFISSNIHSSVSGTVVKVEDYPGAGGYRSPAIFIDVEGDEWEESIDRTEALNKECALSPEEIVGRLKSFGIVGLGGATFPSHVKLMVPAGKKPEFLIINGVECEPYLTSDHRLMMEHGEELMVGISILMKGLGVTKAFIGIENNKPDAIGHLSKLASSWPGIEVHPLKVKYPQGGEKQLIKALVNREVPSGKLPIEVGCVVNNVGTAFAVYEAVQKNKPLFERVVTVTGKSIPTPGNFMVRIGTLVSALLVHSGFSAEDGLKVIGGGPMMGKALTNLDVPVVKGTSGILVMPASESKRMAEQSCIRCSRCTTVCPMGLEPFQLATESERAFYELAEKDRILDCIECGSCHYTCPSGRHLLDHIRVGKAAVAKLIRARAAK